MGRGPPGGCNRPMNVSGTQGTPGVAPQQLPPAARPPAAPQPNLVQVIPAPGMTLQWGQILRGQVLEQTAGRFTVRFGSLSMEARSQVPLQPGEHIEVQVQGPGADGRVNLQLLRSSLFGSLVSEDLVQTLTGMRQPVDDRTMALARSMVEVGLPLTARSLGEMRQALAQLPAQSPADAAAAGFLKLNALPLSPENITALAVFMTQHPMLGAQLFEINGYMRRLAGEPGALKGTRAAEMLARIPGLLGEFILNPAQQNRQRLQRSMFRLARQMGIESLSQFGPDLDPAEWLELLRLQRQALGPEEQALAQVLELLEGLEGNLKAHTLINLGRRGEEGTGWYCLQVPLRLDEEVVTGRLRITYRHDAEGRTWVDEDDVSLEFSVESQLLGSLAFRIRIKGEVLDLEVGTGCEEVRQVVETHLPALLANLKGLGFMPGRSQVGLLPEGRLPQTDLVARVELEALERVNLRM